MVILPEEEVLRLLLVYDEGVHDSRDVVALTGACRHFEGGMSTRESDLSRRAVDEPTPFASLESSLLTNSLLSADRRHGQ